MAAHMRGFTTKPPSPPRRKTKLQLRMEEVSLPKTEAQKALRENFIKSENEFLKQLDLSRLSESDRLIHARHSEAIQGFHLTYSDPATELKVFTRLRHFLKGKCCGSACRHCVFQHLEVKEERRRERRFNSAFWEDVPKGENKGYFDR